MTVALPLMAATTAMLVREPRRGATVRGVPRLPTVRAAAISPGQAGLVTAAVVSELRDNPRGAEIGSDFETLTRIPLRCDVDHLQEPALAEHELRSRPRRPRRGHRRLAG